MNLETHMIQESINNLRVVGVIKMATDATERAMETADHVIHCLLSEKTANKTDGTTYSIIKIVMMRTVPLLLT